MKIAFSKAKISFILLVAYSLLVYIPCTNAQPKLFVVTVATNLTDGFKRLDYSLQHFGYDYEVLGLGEKWNGGNVQITTGGGQKINLLRKYLEATSLKDDDILLYVDGYDIIINEEPSEVIKRFLDSKRKLLFSAEHFCWPDLKLKEKYPNVEPNEYRFLNSGAFMGYVEYVKSMLGTEKVSDDSDDQLFYTNYFLNHYNENFIGLDVRSNIFQNLNGAQNDVTILYQDGQTMLKNVKMETYPIIVHGNGPTKIILNRIGNYIGGTWSSDVGCISCDQLSFDLFSIDQTKWPSILIYVKIMEPISFISEFFNNLRKLTYPGHKLHLIIHNKQPRWNSFVDEFLKINDDYYASTETILGTIDEYEGFKLARSTCNNISCNYLLLLNGEVQLIEDEALTLLIGLNRSIVSPIVTRENTLFSNFWGAVSKEGFYQRSDDYIDIVNKKRIGVWNVPFISSCILFKQEVINEIELLHDKDDQYFDMALCADLRGKGIFMWASNIHKYGYLVNNENYKSDAIHPELYEIFDNPYMWKQRYLEPRFIKFFEDIQTLPHKQWTEKYMRNEDINSSDFFIREPCPDVFWFPLFSKKFTTEIINTCEASDAWSLGKHLDERIPGGYENVPTDDIHMTQLSWQDHWMQFLSTYIEPVQKRIFLGYSSNPIRAPLSFVVRYDKQFQDFLKPHHDASTYTLDIALNQYGKDYTAGGVRFLRYNCSLIDTPIGWTLMFPGRLTHLHEGLKINSGRRYVFVSFIDP